MGTPPGKSSSAYPLQTQLKCLIKGGPAPCTPGFEVQGLLDLNAWFAHLTTGKILATSPDWRYGHTEQNGRFGLSQQSGSVSLSAQNTMVATHEIGHNFGGLHYAADYTCLNGHCGHTIMWQHYSAGACPTSRTASTPGRTTARTSATS